ncbi:Isoleucine--tRNA ligase, partial [Mycoplasma putrefaciens]
MNLRDDVNKALEIAREAKIINKGFEAVVTIKLNDQFKELSQYKELAQIFIVNSIIFVEQSNQDFIKCNLADIKVEQKQGIKCQRCW